MLTRKAVADDIPRLGCTLGLAFAADPIVNWIFPGAEIRTRVLPAFFSLQIRHLYLPHDEVYAADDLVAAALWLPPGQTAPGLASILRLAIRLAPFLPRAGRALPRIPRLLNTLDANHPKEPHYYLAVLGTEPAEQGKGYGRALLEPLLERCDREAMPAYLESSSPRNLSLYNRHGFKVTKELKIGKDGPSMWPMWREPR